MSLATISSRSLKAPEERGGKKQKNIYLSGDTEIENGESLLPKAVSFREKKIPIFLFG